MSIPHTRRRFLGATGLLAGLTAVANRGVARAATPSGAPALELAFAGWFQVRLPTDPDPYDEPRGVTGYAWALPGEPDFDRVIHFQPKGVFQRVGCTPEIAPGVTVRGVKVSGRTVDDHPLLGAAVELADRPTFEGHNGIVAEDGFEPIVPLRILFAGDRGTFGRSYAETYQFPYTELQANGVEFSDEASAAIAAATGISDLGAIWQKRADRLEQVIRTTHDEALAEACRFRLSFMQEKSWTLAYFGAWMHYSMKLTGPVTGPKLIPEIPARSVRKSWPLVFWMGGWDADAQCAFVNGTFSVPR